MSAAGGGRSRASAGVNIEVIGGRRRQVRVELRDDQQKYDGQRHHRDCRARAGALLRQQSEGSGLGGGDVLSTAARRGTRREASAPRVSSGAHLEVVERLWVHVERLHDTCDVRRGGFGLRLGRGAGSALAQRLRACRAGCGNALHGVGSLSLRSTTLPRREQESAEGEKEFYSRGVPVLVPVRASPVPSPVPSVVRKRILQPSSLAQHWARDWLALALTQAKKNFTTKLPRTTLGTGLARTGEKELPTPAHTCTDTQPLPFPFKISRTRACAGRTSRLYLAKPTEWETDSYHRSCHPRRVPRPPLCQLVRETASEIE